jgi:SAM-dependent methyltransferase
VSRDSHAAAWDALADADPLWAICVRKSGRGGNWDVAEFLATGASEIDWAIGLLTSRDQLPTRHRLAVDFGAGVGRLSQPLTKHFDAVIGVDTSETMRRMAAQMAAELPCSFAPDLAQVDTGSVDLIYSSLVLQHIDEHDLPALFAEFRRVLHPDGVALLHYPLSPGRTLRGVGFRVLPPKTIARLQTHVLRYPAPMAMSWMSASRMSGLLNSAGLDSTVVPAGLQHSRHWKDGWYIATASDGA